MGEISKYDDLIDSRDVIERIAELQAVLDAGESLGDDRDEYMALTTLAEEASGYIPDWEYGETLIRDSYFKEYAQELAEDIGAITGDETWPASCIDWDQAARELQMDYTAVEFDGVTYWTR
jgi:antirestriction protein